MVDQMKRPKIGHVRALCLLLSIVCICLHPSPAIAQTFSFPGSGIQIPGLKSPLPISKPAAASSTSAPTPPSAASHTPVMFNNKPLFEVYAANAQTAQDRADLATYRLKNALKAIQSRSRTAVPQTSAVIVKSATGGAPETIIKLDGSPLLTVTQIDADNCNKTIPALADFWSDQINAAFESAVREQEPAYLRHAAIKSGIIIGVALLINFVLWYFAKRLRGNPGWPIRILIWSVVIRACLYQFPQTRPFVAWLLFYDGRPFMAVFDICLSAAVVARLWGTVLARLFPPMTDSLSHEEVGRRSFQRRATLAAIARVTGVAIIWIVAVITALGKVGVNFSTLLASAGLIGVGIGLATQDMMKDLVAGINILADDRFGVGDTIQMGEYEGRVERLDLRITQIRDLSGRLITIPNRNIAQVANMTSSWAQVDLRIGVSYYDDLKKAENIMVTAAETLKEESPDRIIAGPDMLGVDSFNDSNITLRMLVRTPPGEQWHVARTLRVLIKAAFDREGIAFFNALHVAKAPAAELDSSDAPEPGKNGADVNSDTKLLTDSSSIHA